MILKELGSGEQGKRRVFGVNSEDVEQWEMEGVLVDKDGPGVELFLCCQVVKVAKDETFGDG